MSLTFTDGDRTLTDCPHCGQAAPVQAHGGQLSPMQCFAGHKITPEDVDVPAILAELGAPEPATAAENGKGTVTSGETPFPTEWPELSEAAYHGLVGEIVRAVEPHSEADTSALLIQLVVMLGNACGRGPGFTVEGDFHSTVLYAAIVGESSKARKGSSLGQVLAVMRLADAEWSDRCVASGLSTGEGLIHHIRDPRSERRKAKTKGEKATADSDGYIVEEVDPGVEEKRLLAVAGEFAQMLKVMAREGNTLSPVVRDLWDHGRARTLTKGQPEAATNAHASIIAHITVEELRRHLPDTEIANGFANRFLFVCSRRSKLLPFGGEFPEHERHRFGALLRGALDHARDRGALGLDESAREIWAAVYPDVSKGEPGLLGAAVGRAEAQVRRLAVVYALLDGADTVAAPHLRAALAVWDYCHASAAYVFGGKIGNRLADRLARDLRIACGDGLTRSEIRTAVGGHVPADRIDTALGALRARGLATVEHEPTAGRPIERWRWSTPVDKGVRPEETDLRSDQPPFATAADSRVGDHRCTCRNPARSPRTDGPDECMICRRPVLEGIAA